MRASARRTGLPAGARRSVSTSRWWARCSKSGVSRHSPSPSLTCAIRSPPRRVASQPITRDQPLRPRRNAFDPWTRSFRDHRDGRKRMTENAAVVVGVDGSEGSLAALRWSALEAHRRQLPLRIVAAGGLDAVMPATASESFWRHLSAHQESWANDVVNDAADLARQTAPVEPQTAVYLTETAVIALQARGRVGGSARRRLARAGRCDCVAAWVDRNRADAAGFLPGRCGAQRIRRAVRRGNRTGRRGWCRRLADVATRRGVRLRRGRPAQDRSQGGARVDLALAPLDAVYSA